MGNPSNTFRNENVAHTGMSGIPSAVVGGFPDREIVTLRYAQRNLLTCTAGAMATQTFRGNSVFDPDFTGTGAQPANFDDFALRYNRYRVVGSRISTVAINASGVSGVIAVYPWNASAATTMDDTMSQPYVIVNQVSSNAALSVNTISTSKILGRTQAQILGSDSCAANVGANPTDVWFWSIRVEPMDVNTTSTYEVRTIIDYQVHFFDRVAGNLDDHIERLLEIKTRKEALKWEKKSEHKEEFPDAVYISKVAGMTQAKDLGDTKLEVSTTRGQTVNDKPENTRAVSAALRAKSLSLK
jgi:hypothetical protein